MSMAAAAREGATGGVQLSMSSSESRAAGAGSSGGGLGAGVAAAMQVDASSSEPRAAGASSSSGGVGASAAAAEAPLTVTEAIVSGVGSGGVEAGNPESPKKKGKKRSMGADQRANLARQKASA